MTATEVKAAKAVCNSCPSQMSCLSSALLHNEEFGIWGGFAAHERRTALARHGGDMNKAMADFEAGHFVLPRKRKKRASE